MRQYRSKSIGILALLVALTATGWSQDQAAPAKPEEPEEKVQLPKLNSITLGYTGWMKRDDDRFASRSVSTPVNGLSITELSLIRPFQPGKGYQSLKAVNLGAKDFAVDAMAVMDRIHTTLKGNVRHINYHYVDVVQTKESQRRETNLETMTMLTQDIGAFFSYKKVQQSQAFVAPKPNRHSKSETYAGGVEGKMLGGYAGASFSSKRFTDQSSQQPTSEQRRYEFNYAVELNDKASVAATMGHTKILQRNLRDSGVRNMGLSATYDISDKSTLQFDASRVELTLPNAGNAFDRERLQYGFKLSTRCGDWATQFGFRHKETERVNSDRTFVDVPAWDVYEFRASSKVGGDKRLTLRGSWENLRDGFQPQTDDTTRMLWDDNVMGQIKLAGGTDLQQMYGTYTYRWKQNRARAINLGWHNMTVGVSHTFNPQVNGYAEAGYDAYHTGSTFAGTGTPLRYYFRDSMSLALGLNWLRGTGESFSASMNSYATNNVLGRQFTFGYHRELSPDRSLHVSVSPWVHDDRLHGLTGYTNTAAQVQLQVKF